MEAKKLYREKEVAQILGVNHKTLQTRRLKRYNETGNNYPWIVTDESLGRTIHYDLEMYREHLKATCE